MSIASHINVSEIEHGALLRLLRVACESTGKGRRVAEFLLAWWDAEGCGGVELTSTWGLDVDLAEDVIIVFALAVRSNSYPDTLGYGEEFQRIRHVWRPASAPKASHADPAR